MSDTGNHRIRKIVIATGVVTTLSGTGITGRTNSGANSTFDSPMGLVIDSTNANLYVADRNNNLIRKIVLSNVAVSYFAGKTTGVAGSTNGTGTTAAFSQPVDIAIDSTNNLYVLDQGNSLIRKITTGAVVTTFYNGSSGDNIAIDSAGSVYLANWYSATIDKITSTGVYSQPYGGIMNVRDGVNNNSGLMPMALKYLSSNNTLYFFDNYNLVRKVALSTGTVSTIAGNAGFGSVIDGTGVAGQFFAPRAIVKDSHGDFFITDSQACRIKKLTVSTGFLSFFAGGGQDSCGSADGTGVLALFNQPDGLVIDSLNNLYVSDKMNHTIRKITPAGVVTTFAGLSGIRGKVDGSGSSARFSEPMGLAIDSRNNIYVADFGNNAVRKITPTGVVTTILGHSLKGYFKLGHSPEINAPYTLAIYKRKLYISSDSDNVIVSIDLPK